MRDDLAGSLTPGSQHLLTTEIWGAAPPLGTDSPAWISYLPDPTSAVALDSWNFAADHLTYDSDAKPLPYPALERGALRCFAEVDSSLAGKTVMFHVVTSNAGDRRPHRQRPLLRQLRQHLQLHRRQRDALHQVR